MKLSTLHRAQAHTATVMEQVATLQTNEEWQATLAGIRERFPNGVMNP